MPHAQFSVDVNPVEVTPIRPRRDTKVATHSRRSDRRPIRRSDQSREVPHNPEHITNNRVFLDILQRQNARLGSSNGGRAADRELLHGDAILTSVALAPLSNAVAVARNPAISRNISWNICRGGRLACRT